ncbi:thiamine pyrophosphokinase [Mucilaginibacter litoreus]|uniref:Thiamine pyrophosphokinase n=1 Tax=Mucilaginibacter litoreus TaxID=1048221 RepID=A0ABW3AXM5_9SPHI
MSSHHIVREKQEPALVVLGLKHFSDELLGQLLEWSPTVITVPDVAEQLNAQVIKIDYIIADTIDEALQADVKRIAPGSEPAIQAALGYLTHSGYKAVNVVADDIVLKDFEEFVDKINQVIYSGGQKTYAITSGFSKWKPAGDIVQLLTDSTGLSISGYYQREGNKITTIQDGFLSLKFDSPFIFIAEEM